MSETKSIFDIGYLYPNQDKIINFLNNIYSIPFGSSKECGATKNEKMLHCDHIISVAQGGTDELSNLQALCGKCNLSKSKKNIQ